MDIQEKMIWNTVINFAVKHCFILNISFGKKK